MYEKIMRISRKVAHWVLLFIISTAMGFIGLYILGSILALLEIPNINNFLEGYTKVIYYAFWVLFPVDGYLIYGLIFYAISSAILTRIFPLPQHENAHDKKTGEPNSNSTYPMS
ncbi:hypothetical protein HGA91_06255 [candidate division WWE3 bacterium]|nr:hypothetical protein [candidate division WWE3 bacterium]